MSGRHSGKPVDGNESREVRPGRRRAAPEQPNSQRIAEAFGYGPVLDSVSDPTPTAVFDLDPRSAHSPLPIPVEYASAPQPAPFAVHGSPQSFLDVRDLRVHFATEDGLVRAVDGLSFQLGRGKTLGIVGESGSGKSVTALSLLGLHRRPDRKGRGGAHVSGEIWLDGRELISASPEELRALRGREMAMIFQDSLSALHPYYTVGAQIAEAYRVHNDVSKADAKSRAVDLLARVGIPQPSARVDDYPHQFSGGMRQRVMIAVALACNPALLIADEPTTALDVTVQAQILDLMRDLQQEHDSALILITHDLGVVAELADDIMVMYGGKAVEYGPAKTVFTAPEHPYTWGLLGSMPRLDQPVQDRLVHIPGSPPSMINVPSGCAFHPRCAYTAKCGTACASAVPELTRTAGEAADAGEEPHLVRCHLPNGVRQNTFREQIRTAQ